jgi:hypothetical protein
MRKSRFAAVVGVASLAAGLGTATSATTIYTNRAAWLAAVTGVTTDGFETGNLPVPFTPHPTGYSGAGFTITPVYPDQLYTVDPTFAFVFNWNSGYVLDFEAENATIDGGANFGFDYGNPSASDVPVAVTINGIEYASNPRPSFGFFGMTGATGPISIAWRAAGLEGQGIIDNFSVATGTVGGAVPEPASWAMLIAGFGLVGAAARRRRNARLA